MDKRKQIDWEAIQEEFTAGQISVAEIARRYDTSHQAIFQRAKRKGWQRDLSSRVRKRVAQKLVADVADRNATDEEIAEAAANRGANVIRMHRKDIASLQELEEQLIKELKDKPTKLYITQYQGEIVQKEVGLTAYERAAAANNLANVQHKRIQLERQAFNLDATPDDDGAGKVTMTWFPPKPRTVEEWEKQVKGQ